MSDHIDIRDLGKAEVLQALFNASKQQGMGFFDATGAVPMSIEDARRYVAKTYYFDYLRGRVMKVDIGGELLDPWGYDRDNGAGAAKRALRPLLEKATK